MSDFFNKSESKVFIAPDYTGEIEEDKTDEIDLDDDDDSTDEDEGAFEAALDRVNSNNGDNFKEGNKMTVSTFGGDSNSSSSPQVTPFGGSAFSSKSTYNYGGSSYGSSYGGGSFTYGGNNKTTGTENFGFANPGNGSNQKVQINREKKIIICDFFDTIIETYQSNGVPGFMPRDIYDIKPRFEVWSRLRAYNSEVVYVVIPENFLQTVPEQQEKWMLCLDYFCASLCSYIHIPFENCKVLTRNTYYSKGENLKKVLVNEGLENVKDLIVNIGVYSGGAGQSNEDYIAAREAGIDYVDLWDLINNMY